MYVYVCIYVCIFIYIHSAGTQYCEILNISKETSPMECWCWRPDKYQQQIWYIHYISRITELRPGPRLNMKTVYSRHDCSHVNRLLFILHPPRSISNKTSYHKISWSLKAARFVFRVFRSLPNFLRNLNCIAAEAHANFWNDAIIQTTDIARH